MSEQASRRYVDALLNTARKDKKTDMTALAAQLGELAESLSHEGLHQYLTNPAVSQQHKVDTVAELLQKAKTPELLQRLVLLLVENHRLASLPAIAHGFAERVAQEAGRVDVVIQTPVSLTATLERKLVSALQRRFGYRDVQVTQDIDPTLLGGAVLRIGDWVMDGSYKTRLQQLLTTKG